MAAVKIANVDALIKTLNKQGYPEVEKKTSNRVVVYTGKGEDRKTTLQGIASGLGGRYTPSKTGTGWRSSVGAALVGNYVIIAKPSTKSGSAGALSALDARQFSGSGKMTKFNYLGQDIESVVFTSPKQIEDSIIKGAKTSSMLGQPIADAFDEFFKTGTIAWSPGTPPAAVNKLGVYVGEVLTGWVFLKKQQRNHFMSNPFKGTPKAFYLPTDPAFSGVDSFIEMTDGSYYGISSKFGAGAKASIFSNLLDKGMKKESKLSKSVFKDLAKTANANNLTYKKSREIVYTFGVRNILNISASQIANPSVVYDQIKAGKLGKEAKMVVAAITNHKASTDLIEKNLPESVSAFFNRTIADMLNKDKKSIEQMKEILQGKDYWQGNLQIPQWAKGDVKFKWLSSAQANLSIIGSKGAATDISSKQGWINYELKYT